MHFGCFMPTKILHFDPKICGEEDTSSPHHTPFGASTRFAPSALDPNFISCIRLCQQRIRLFPYWGDGKLSMWLARRQTVFHDNHEYSRHDNSQ